MAVDYDADTQSTHSGSGAWSFTHTPTGTPRGIILLIGQHAGLTPSSLTATYGGDAMTLEEAVDGGTGQHSHLFFLGTGISTGAQSVVVSGQEASKDYSASCISYTADADTEKEVSATKNSGTRSVDLVTGASVNTAIAGLISIEEADPANVTKGGDYTELVETDWGDRITNHERRTSNGTGGTIAVDWSTLNEDFAIAAIAIKESATAFLPRQGLTVSRSVVDASLH